ncbi:MAG: homocysteine S-methyltransferase family protein [Deltaproteobacteria bacterium]|nr:homocysteine S-methyltransferase family protein [Deltaproteobacteria bacterium]
MKDFLILDGPTGTELIARGFPSEPGLWTARAALEAPDLLRQVHRDYLAAGANILTANTFRTSSYALAKGGYDAAFARRLTHASMAVATEAIEEFSEDAAGGPRFLAGSLAPIEDCYRPQAAPELATLERVHAETAAWLVEAGADLILAETMGSAREALVAVRAARRAGASVSVSFITDESGARLLGGDTVLVNCVHSDVVEKALGELQPLASDGVVLGAYANAARMRVHPITGAVEWESDSRPVEQQATEYGGRAEAWARRFGARIIGGCCDMTPLHVRALTQAFRK